MSLFRARSYNVSHHWRSMGQLAVVNAPYSFAYIWAAVKPWLAKETQEKVDILGPNYQEVLLNIVDAENLPESLGGKCTCEKEGGCQFSSAGPWMENRKERRDKWLRGELKSAGLSLELRPIDDVAPANGETSSQSRELSKSVSATKPDDVLESGAVSNGHGEGESL